MAASIVSVASRTDTLIVPVWMSRRLSDGYSVMERAGLLPFLSLSDAIAALSRAIAWKAEPAPPAALPPAASDARALSEADAKAMLRDAGLPMPAGRIARSADEAAAHAAALGFPVVMKVVSAQILHKTEAGGVRLGIASEDAARQAHAAIHEAVARHRPDARIDGVLVERMLPPGGREVLIGVHRDAAFGLVMTFGLGGIYVETLRDVAHRMIPLSPEDARALTREIRHVEILDGVRGQAPADFAALEALILRVSDFAWQHRDTLHELELNPVWVGAAGQGAVPLDALLAFQGEARAD